VIGYVYLKGRIPYEKDIQNYYQISSEKELVLYKI
jgi:hypothetical protein